MFAPAFRHAPSLRLNGAAPMVRRLSPARIAITVIPYLWLAFVAALFAHWLAASHSPRASGEAGESACVSLGRGGALCEPVTSSDGRQRASAPDDACVSLGRGGRLCRP